MIDEPSIIIDTLESAGGVSSESHGLASQIIKPCPGNLTSFLSQNVKSSRLLYVFVTTLIVRFTIIAVK